ATTRAGLRPPRHLLISERACRRISRDLRGPVLPRRPTWRPPTTSVVGGRVHRRRRLDRIQSPLLGGALPLGRARRCQPRRRLGRSLPVRLRATTTLELEKRLAPAVTRLRRPHRVELEPRGTALQSWTPDDSESSASFGAGASGQLGQLAVEALGLLQ